MFGSMEPLTGADLGSRTGFPEASQEEPDQIPDRRKSERRLRHRQGLLDAAPPPP